MAHGMPDFGIYAPKETTFNLADLADLAVRLGSIVEYDRRGDVIFLDDFTGPAPKFRELAAAGCSAKFDSTTALSGGESVKFLLGGALDDYASINYYLAPVITAKHGIAIALCHYDAHSRSQEIVIVAEVYNGARYLYCGIRFNPNAKTIEYSDSAFNWVAFETDFQPISANEWMFHNIKLVVDWDNAKYVRLLYDVRSWDLSPYSFYSEVNLAGPQLWVAIELKAKTASIEKMWADNFIYTINEP